MKSQNGYQCSAQEHYSFFSIHEKFGFVLLPLLFFWILLFSHATSFFFQERLFSKFEIASSALYRQEELRESFDAEKNLLNRQFPIFFFNKTDMLATYSFDNVRTGFYSIVPLARTDEISKYQFQQLIIKSVPSYVQKNLSLFLPTALAFAEKHQVDPFWVLAVMWAESNFNSKAVSRKKATGLMQIMPDTGRFLSQKMNLSLKTTPRKLLVRAIFRPDLNIEMGVVYLNMLLQQFKNDYRLATVSYNMGPYLVLNKIKMKIPVGAKNRYLDSVRNSYLTLIQGYVNYMENKQRPYENTFVVYRHNSPDILLAKLFSVFYADSFLVDFTLKATDIKV